MHGPLLSKLAMISDCEAVRFISHPRYEVGGGTRGIKNDRFFNTGKKYSFKLAFFAFIAAPSFGETDHIRLANFQFLQDIESSIKLSFASVDQDEVGKQSFVFRPRISPMNHLCHARKVILASHGLYFKTLIMPFIRKVILKADHARNRFRSLNLRNVEGFD